MESQLSCFKSWKMMLWKCCTEKTKFCTQCASKFGKLSSGHKTGKGQITFQPQRKAMPRNVQTTTQLCSFHLKTRFFSKSFKLSFTSTWTENFQMFKLDLEKAEEPQIKLPTLVESWRKQENCRRISTSFIDYAKAFDCVSQQTEKFLKRWEYQITLPAS